MNELVFFLQIISLFVFAYFSLKLGRDALVAYICIASLCANIFVLQQVTLFGATVTSSDAFAVSTLLGLNLMREYFGVDRAKQTIVYSFFFFLFFTVMSQIHLSFTPAPTDYGAESYHLIFSPIPRILYASLAAFALTQYFDLFLFGLLSRLFPTRSFAIRSAASLLCSQTLDTIVFSFLGLYGMVSALRDVIFFSLSIKLISIVCLSPFLSVFKKRRAF